MTQLPTSASATTAAMGAKIRAVRSAGGVTNPAKIYLVAYQTRTITTYNAYGSPSVPDFQTDLNPRDVAVDPNGNIWAGCYRSHHSYLAEYSFNGKVLLGIYDAGTGGPISVFANATGVYIQSAVGSIEYFTFNGTEFGSFFQYQSVGFGVDSVGHVYTTTIFHGSLRMITGEGSVPIVSRLAYPGEMTVDAAGNFYVSSLDFDGKQPMLTVFNPEGIRTGVRFALSGVALKVAVDASGIIYILTDTGLYTYHADGTPAHTTIHGNFSGMTVVG